MKSKSIFCVTLFSFFFVFNFSIENLKACSKHGSTILLQTDADSNSLKSFKLFSKKFFDAIKKNDTAFLKQHMIFPIKNSSFSIFDHSLDNRIIESTIILRQLHKFFPDDLLQQVITNKAAFSIAEHPDSQTRYIITLYDEDDGGVESNYTWIFIKQHNDFYFVNFQSEAG